MLFNSLDFAFFLPIVFTLYWFVANKNLKIQNLLIVLASYFFYGWWDLSFLSLIFLSTFTDYFIGLSLAKERNEFKRKILLWISLFVNLGILFFFKYFNFFLDSFISSFTLLGFEIGTRSLNIILPVGISFYTFQTLSYTIDVYKRKLNPTKDFIAFSAFVCFFPQLVAGPIERATHLLPQFFKHRKFEKTNAINGMRQILWGLFKKIVIADNCAYYANLIFNNSIDLSSGILIAGAIFFAFQIYGDFSGYSDIAIGTSRLFGFELMKNFAFPYFSRDIAEFWRRWHISLSTWFRDYLYIPLGGSRGGVWMKVRNTFLIFIVSGFWHGANWTFIIWGALNALYFLPLLLRKKNRTNLSPIQTKGLLPTLKDAFNIFFTFALTTLAWVFFRAENLDHALKYLKGIFSTSLFTLPFHELTYLQIDTDILYLALIVFLFLLVEWIQRTKEHGLELPNHSKLKLFRWFSYYSIIILIFYFNGEQQEFIYFQF